MTRRLRIQRLTYNDTDGLMSGVDEFSFVGLRIKMSTCLYGIQIGKTYLDDLTGDLVSPTSVILDRVDGEGDVDIPRPSESFAYSHMSLGRIEDNDVSYRYPRLPGRIALPCSAASTLRACTTRQLCRQQQCSNPRWSRMLSGPQGLLYPRLQPSPRRSW